MIQSLKSVLERELQAAPSSTEIDNLRLDIGRIESINSHLPERLRRASGHGSELQIINFSDLERSYGTDVARELCKPLMETIAAHESSPAYQGVIKEVPIKHFRDHYLVAQVS